MYRKIFLCAALTLIVGCSYIAKKVMEPPKAKVERVSLKDASISGATIVFGVEVDNPNPFAVRVDDLNYAVEVGGKPIGKGQIESSAQVGGRSKAVIDLPVPVKFSDVFSSLLDFVTTGTSAYHIKGEARFGLIKVPFDKTGELKLKP
jgi:LEA14-like dessication related protein